MTLVLLSTSIVCQVAAAIFALRLIRVTGQQLAWMFIASAVMLMAVRRGITLYRTISSDLAHPADPVAELVALVISILILAGILLIEPIFRHIQQTGEARRELENQIADAQKVQSMEMLAGGIAHDFNNLLQSILGNANLARYELPKDSAARPYLDKVEQGIDRASDLTSQMLAYSGSGQQGCEIVDLSQLVDEMVELFRATISRNCVLQCKTEGVLPVKAEVSRIRQLLLNVIKNASEAIGAEGGVITVGTSRWRRPPEGLSDDWWGEPEGDELALLEVIDTGEGIDEQSREKIFQPYFTTKAGRGRGLGLAAVRGVVHGHGGSLHLTSTPGHGTTIRILLPLTEEEPARSLVESTAGVAKGKLLIVDDEETIRQFLEVSLTRAGFEVLVRSNGLEAVKAYEQHHAELRAVVMDMSMPGMDGQQAVGHMRSIDTEVPVVLISGYNPQHWRERADQSHNLCFLPKPFPPAELVTLLKKLDASRTPPSPEDEVG